MALFSDAAEMHDTTKRLASTTSKRQANPPSWEYSSATIPLYILANGSERAAVRVDFSLHSDTKTARKAEKLYTAGPPHAVSGRARNKPRRR